MHRELPAQQVPALCTSNHAVMQRPQCCCHVQTRMLGLSNEAVREHLHGQRERSRYAHKGRQGGHRDMSEIANLAGAKRPSVMRC